MRVRVLILLVLIFLSYKSQAQRDSVLQQHIVYGIPEEKYLAGSRIEKLDSTIKADYRSGSLAEMLSFQFPIYFRTYGSGMLSGISMRGTSPQHTAVLWNGLNINSFSLGQSDFSILPAVAFDDIKIHSGGGSARFGSGAFGGAVLLQSGSDNNPLLEASMEAGSFGRFSGSIKTSFTKGSFSSSSSLYRVQSQNDFIIRGNGRQQHAAFQQQGFVQHLQYDLSEASSLTLDYWIHDANREIQPTIGNQNNPNEQKDEQQDLNNRLSISYQQNNTAGLLKIVGGVINDRITFNGKPSDVLRYISTVNHQYTISKWNIQAGVDWNHIIGKIDEYDGNATEDRTDVAASVQREFQKVRLSVTLRKPFITGIEAPLLPYVGADLFIVRKEESSFMLRASASKNFRAPTLNDRYWRDAGREDLLPETSHAVEGGMVWEYQTIKFGAGAFYQLIDNWIQWSPVAGSGIFRPENIKQVKAKGFDVSIELNKSILALDIHAKASYQYTSSTTTKAQKAEEGSIGKQLIYTPFHSASAFVTTKISGWSIDILAQYSGKRFIESTNAPGYSLKPFALVDVSIGRNIVWNRNIVAVRFTGKNVFDTNYQLYSGRAMPGRNFLLQIFYQLNHKSN